MARVVTDQIKNPDKRLRPKNFDYSLFFIVLFILSLGFVMLYSTSAYTATLRQGNAFFFLRKQVFASILGMGAMMFFTFFDYHRLKKYAPIAYVVSFVLCVLVIFTGSNLNGSSRWLRIGGISVQPSEIAKVAMIVFFAAIISGRTNALKDFRNVVKTLGLIIPIFGVVSYTNLSTGIIIAGIVCIMLFIAYPKVLPFLAIGGGGLVMVALFIGTAGYRATRIDAWLHPENYVDGTGYQTLQGLYAIGSGGLFGKGLGNGTQKLGFVPEANNDMIFSILCEELGIFGAVCIILLYILLLYRLLYIANHAKDMFGSYLAIGIMAHIALQVVLNIAVVSNSMPNTGVTLPFISYGGTSVAILLGEMGIALGVSRQMDFDDGLEYEDF